MTVKASTGILIGLVVFLFGFIVCMVAGRWGMHPLDSPIVFDGAWRILSGQRFFQDFNSPNGFVPIGMQVAFFKLLGVNWWAYRIHAAVINGFFGLLVLGILRMSGASRLVATAYACMSTIVFYPPMATPYMEQHAFFFILLGVFLVMSAANAGTQWRFWIWAMVPATWALAILSKQSPGFFAIPLSLLAMGAHWKLHDLKAVLKGLIVGLVGVFLVFWLFVGWPFGMNGTFWRYFWTYPREIGVGRAAKWQHGLFKSIRSFAWLPFQVLGGFHLVFRYLLYLPFLGLACEWIWCKWRRKEPLPSYPVGLLLLGIGLVLSCSFFMHSTLNQMENGLPFVFLAVGLGHGFWKVWLRSLGSSAGMSQRMRDGIGLGLALLLIGMGTWNSLGFHRRVNETRFVLDFEESAALDHASAIDRGIAGLDFVAPYEIGQLKPGDLLAWLKVHEGNFLLMGDLTCLYGLSGRESVTPFLWMHPGLTLPPLDSPAFQATDIALLEATRKYAIRYVIFERSSHLNYMGLQFECFPTTSAAMYARFAYAETIGGFTVWHLK